jgi:hypothetical protein
MLFERLQLADMDQCKEVEEQIGSRQALQGTP